MLRAMPSHRIHICLLLIACCAVCAVSGCAYGEMRQVLRAQIATETDCAEILVEKKGVHYIQQKENKFKVTGCGILRTYTCPQEDGLVEYGKPICNFVEGDSDAPKLAAEVAEGIEDPFADEDGTPAAAAPSEAAAPAEPVAKPAEATPAVTAEPEAKPGEETPAATTEPEAKPAEEKPAEEKPTAPAEPGAKPAEPEAKPAEPEAKPAE